jgi:hypothetical protein
MSCSQHGDPILLCAENGIIQMVNLAAARSLLEKPAAMPGNNIMDYVNGEDREEFLRTCRACWQRQRAPPRDQSTG